MEDPVSWVYTLHTHTTIRHAYWMLDHSPVANYIMNATGLSLYLSDVSNGRGGLCFDVPGLPLLSLALLVFWPQNHLRSNLRTRL